MKFTPLASSSKGNAYLLEAKDLQPLLIEAGIPIKQLRERLAFGLSGLAGCLISHEHLDHSQAVPGLLKLGLDCFMSAGTAEALGVEHHHRFSELDPLNPNFISSRFLDWEVKTIPLQHDATEPVGFLVSAAPECLLFIPDTGYVRNRWRGVTILAVECNHIEEILAANIAKGLPAVLGHRTRRNHMSLATLIEMLKANDLSRCREIWLLHLSDGNSDERRMIKEVQRATGIPCRAAGAVGIYREY